MLLFALACGPKAPPAGWTEISEDVGVRGTEAELPLGEARPFSGEPDSRAERAFADAELAIAAMGRGGPDILARVEQVQALCAVAAEDPALEAAAAARLGDAARIAWEAVLAAEAPDAEVYREVAREAYRRARDGTTPGDPWHAHALWGLHRVG